MLESEGATVLSFGAGQDSTAILYKIVYDPWFREEYVRGRLVIVCSDTGDEHPKTYQHIEDTKDFCAQHGLEFVHITSDMGYHGESWLTLRTQYNKNRNCGSKAYPKTCTSNLKITPIYRWLEDWICKNYGYKSSARSKTGMVSFAEEHGKIRVLIGIAGDEDGRASDNISLEQWQREQRVKKGRSVAKKFFREHQAGLVARYKKLGRKAGSRKSAQSGWSRRAGRDFLVKSVTVKPTFRGEVTGLSKWMVQSVEKSYPLLDLGLNRKACQEYIASVGHFVPPPSNCMLCPFMSEQELLWLYRNHKDDYRDWVRIEQNKIDEYKGRGISDASNFGVWGVKLLPEKLNEAIEKFGHMTLAELDHYKQSHGHCVKSKY